MLQILEATGLESQQLHSLCKDKLQAARVCTAEVTAAGMAHEAALSVCPSCSVTFIGAGGLPSQRCCVGLAALALGKHLGQLLCRDEPPGVRFVPVLLLVLSAGDFLGSHERKLETGTCKTGHLSTFAIPIHFKMLVAHSHQRQAELRYMLRRQVKPDKTERPPNTWLAQICPRYGISGTGLASRAGGMQAVCHARCSDPTAGLPAGSLPRPSCLAGGSPQTRKRAGPPRVGHGTRDSLHKRNPLVMKRELATPRTRHGRH